MHHKDRSHSLGCRPEHALGSAAGQVDRVTRYLLLPLPLQVVLNGCGPGVLGQETFAKWLLVAQQTSVSSTVHDWLHYNTYHHIILCQRNAWWCLMLQAALRSTIWLSSWIALQTCCGALSVHACRPSTSRWGQGTCRGGQFLHMETTCRMWPSRTPPRKLHPSCEPVQWCQGEVLFVFHKVCDGRPIHDSKLFCATADWFVPLSCRFAAIFLHTGAGQQGCKGRWRCAWRCTPPCSSCADDPDWRR